jgi:hypothetical protein
MSQLGDKLLFDDTSVLADRITSLEKQAEKISQLEQQVYKLSEDLKIAIRMIKQLSMRQSSPSHLTSQSPSQSPRPQQASLLHNQLQRPQFITQQTSQFKR